MSKRRKKKERRTRVSSAPPDAVEREVGTPPEPPPTPDLPRPPDPPRPPASDRPPAASPASRSPHIRAKLIDSWPHLLLREATVAAGLCALLLGLALVVDAPLGEIALVTEPDNPEKAPWYFVGVQEMVSYSARSGVLLFPLLWLVGLVLLPAIDRRGARTGRWFADSGAAPVVVGVALGICASTIGLWAWEQELTRPGPFDPALFAVFAAVLAALVAAARARSWHAAGSALFAATSAAYLIFTLVGQLCRGPGWAFFWPWQELAARGGL